MQNIYQYPGVMSQKKLLFNKRYRENPSILVIGTGALGNEAIRNILQAGVKNITIVDNDRVDLKNVDKCWFFNIHLYHNAADPETMVRGPIVGKSEHKVFVIREVVNRLWPNVQVDAFNVKIEDLPADFVAKFDLVLGCVDNLGARVYNNAHCYYYGVPYIDGGVDGNMGRVQVVNPPHGPCLECGMNDSHLRELRRVYTCTGERGTFVGGRIELNSSAVSAVGEKQVKVGLALLLETTKNSWPIYYFNGYRGLFDELCIQRNVKCWVH